MKRIWLSATLLLVVTCAMAQAGGGVVQRGSGRDALRTVTGQVMAQREAPLPNAIVYLKNTKTLTVKTFITDASGNYRFPALSPNVDYEVYAEYKGKRSETKMLSSLDSRVNATINLHVDVR